ncbi:tetratricopeptide repeat protein [Marinobacter koreensis]|uniref:tetratricopeptide repeat protein n=1 Tax=Marinobacter koreensis TaxID=335974 RepID=UPI00360DDDCB
MTDELRVLRATLYQSQHKFDKARTDLRTVIQQGYGPQRLQALLTLANVQTVQGRYDQARTACQQLQQAMPGLISQSCLALVDARTGQAREAYQTLLAGYRQARGQQRRNNYGPWVPWAIWPISSTTTKPSSTGARFCCPTPTISISGRSWPTGTCDIIGHNRYSHSPGAMKKWIPWQCCGPLP